MSDPHFQEKRSLVLSPGEFAMLRDSADGKITLLSGPKAHSPSSSEEPVQFTKSDGYVTCSMKDAIQKDVIAVQGYYVTLFNPTVSGEHPTEGKAHPSSPSLNVGRKINIPGPVNFALWPGQMAEVIRGHHLRSNQYLVIKINDEEQALANWTKSIVKKAESATDPTDPPKADGAPEPDKALKTPKFNEAPADLAVGKRYIIKGTEVSFYIPPTGVTVERADQGVYTRNAVTLERLEYCILVDEDGNKRYAKGPAVVFPTPTESFVTRKNEIKQRATELNPIQGIHVKVIAPYEENGEEFKEGQELFITGEQQAIYYPREEHALVRYDGNAKHFATAVPAGQGRYVMYRLTGEIATVKGPEMLLPDPRTQVLVRRALSDEEVCLWYPANVARGGEALVYNQSLRELVGSSPTTRSGAISEGDYARTRGGLKGGGQSVNFVADSSMEASKTISSSVGAPTSKGRDNAFSNDLNMEQSRHGRQYGGMADEFSHSSSYTSARTVTFGNKYDGVPTIKPQTGYAIQLTNDRGDRRTVQGPATVLLDYDETLQVLSLSKGRPKNHDQVVRTVYLRVKNNQVSDGVTVVTKDHVSITVGLSFRVDFEGDEDKWFEVDNYVKLLVDHARSVLMGAAKQHTSRDMYGDGVAIVRDTILGKSVEGEDGVWDREGMFFSENGMRVKDVEVLSVEINDREIGQMLEAQQREMFKHTLDIDRSVAHLEHVRKQEGINRELLTEKHETEKHQREVQLATIGDELAVALANIGASIEENKGSLDAAKSVDEKISFEHESALARMKSKAEFDLRSQHAKQELTLELILAETASTVERYKALDPNFTAALTTVSTNETMERIAKHVSAAELWGGKDLTEALMKIFNGTPLALAAEKLGLAKLPANGKHTSPTA